MNIDNVNLFVFDFDGVLTNNIVYLNQDGVEWVAASRADGLAFDALKKIGKQALILSTEKNPVVTARASKLGVGVLQGVTNKVEALQLFCEQRNIFKEEVFYVGNDLNDYRVMSFYKYSACPSDSHKKIKEVATYPLEIKGGYGVVRELLEDVFKIDLLELLYP